MSNQDDIPTVAFSLTVKNTSEALEFYTRAFGAEETFRIPTPNGGVAHADFRVGNTTLWISDEAEDWHAFGMEEGAVSSSLIVILTDNCDKSYEQALDAGGEALAGPTNQFWGMRTAIFKDPYGYRWAFREVVEEVSPEETLARAKNAFGEV